MSQTRIRVIAALVVRNERLFLGNCLRHLIENGIDYVIVDNESTDETAELLQQPYFAKHLIGYQTHPYHGYMDWEDLMLARQAAADAVDADWTLYVSADEIMHSYNAGETLSAAIERVDAAGFDVIDFNEFVFLPIETDYVPDRDGPQLLRYYYFFEDQRPRLMRARKKRLQVSHLEHGGHILAGEPFRLSPETFALRHYMFRNQPHAFEKYARRVYAAKELARGWHLHGFQHPVANFAFPPADQLECLASPDDRTLSLVHPHKTPYWMWKPLGLGSRHDPSALQRIEACTRFDIANQTTSLEWHKFETHPNASFRWTGPSPRATIDLPVVFDRSLELRIHVVGAIRGIDHVTLSVYEQTVAHRVERLDNGTFVLHARLDHATLAKADRDFGVTIDTVETIRPVDLAESEDRRWLGVAVAWCELEPAQGSVIA